MEKIFIGKRIETVVREQGRSVGWLAKQIHCERANIYSIFKRESIDTRLLTRFCEILEHNFYKDLSDEIGEF